MRLREHDQAFQQRTAADGAELFEITPIPFMEALRRALAEDPEVGTAPG